MEHTNSSTREIILVSQAIKQELQKRNYPRGAFKIVNYQVDFLDNTKNLIIKIEHEEKLISIDVSSINCDDYVTNTLLKEWIEQDISNLVSTDNLSKITEINNVIEQLLQGISDEIYKSIIKDRLTEFAKEFVEDGIELDTQEIYKKFTKAALSVGKNTIIDKQTDLYSSGFYHDILIGKRDNDSKQAFEIINSIREKNATNELAMVFLDINLFKDINDKYGHKKGDEVLKMLSADLKKMVGDKGIVIRRGGDEFIVIAPVELAKDIVVKQFNTEYIKSNTHSCGFDSSMPISMSPGFSRLNLNIFNNKNTSQKLAIADARSDDNLAFSKILSHKQFGSGRSKDVTDEEHDKALKDFSLALNKELGVASFSLYGDKIKYSAPINSEKINKWVILDAEKNYVDSFSSSLEAKLVINDMEERFGEICELISNEEYLDLYSSSAINSNLSSKINLENIEKNKDSVLNTPKSKDLK